MEFLTPRPIVESIASRFAGEIKSNSMANTNDVALQLEGGVGLEIETVLYPGGARKGREPLSA